MFRLTVFIVLILLNLFACLALVRAVRVWVPPKRRRAILWSVALVVTVMNVPLALFFYRPFDPSLLGIPPWFLRALFYPATAWLATVLLFFMLVGPPALILTLGRAAARLFARRPGTAWRNAAPAVAVRGKPALSRREFLAGGAGLLLPGIYGVAAYSVYGNLDELDITGEHAVPIPHLPPSLEGMTIAQLSDLHVGPYIREKELRHLVSRMNELRPDLVVITGDILDRNLGSLPDMVRGLAGIKSSLGAFAVLGNHDISTDRMSYSARHWGGINIARGLESIGIRTLRNEVVHLGPRQDRLALLGLDWLSNSPGSRSFFSYQQALTRQQLRRLAAKAGPETPRVLLAHHPDTFADALPYEIGLTLAGHTHGGGQVILGSVDRVPIGIAMFRYKYLSGFYREQGCSLYVNRGIGYLGIPVRINCPPEISRFRLVRA